MRDCGDVFGGLSSRVSCQVRCVTTPSHTHQNTGDASHVTTRHPSHSHPVPDHIYPSDHLIIIIFETSGTLLTNYQSKMSRKDSAPTRFGRLFVFLGAKQNHCRQSFGILVIPYSYTFEPLNIYF